MKAVLIRTGSAPVLSSSLYGSPKFSLSDHESVTGILFSGKKSTLHLEIKEKKKKESLKSIRRSLSENDVIRSVKVSVSKSRSFPAIIPEKEEGDLVDEILKKKSVNLDSYDRMSGIWRERNVLKEENEYFGGGLGKGRNIGGGNGGNGSGNNDLNGGNADQSNMSEYYQKLLKSDPGNPLILRNYGKFLHEMKGDVVKAEECYARAILANPGDGELLSLYGKLIWDSSKDGVRAESYFDQAVQASPDDCYVMGSYANFLWNSEEDDEEEEWSDQVRSTSSALVEAC
ncbi:Tetratricopeptide repeat (TPR)-like superfamily protein [Thalictrum thalictroides]|uniref:Tetratricopeptide repeat (TPR)-like superfamily protein n=1 Tax=Thalictrum thalictroides TaxID=46969 RepID=A0A7J6VZM6_THATH|nr:Tetratricopeptide repeat (TPR)-like superfamily protein [Thalictrum thalictroides]